MSETGVEILFHEYALSPFSEKIRRIFGYKGMAYRSVEQPMWMPKPKLTPLTGGYRRIPVMQIGADVYCDTACIARKLEALQPSPSIVPGANNAAAEGVAAWADRQLFAASVPLVFGALAEALPPELVEDRRKMRPDLSMDRLKAAVPDCRNALRSACDHLEDTLAYNDFVLGPSFSLADAAVYHCLWFVRNDAKSGALLASLPRLTAWMQRLEAMGNGKPNPMSGDDALEIAHGASPQTERQADPGDPNGLQPGTRVAICSDDLPSDCFEGEVLNLSAQEIVILREDPDLGKIAQHFPRAGYLVRGL
jgi:glutathione S-transferase